MQRTLEGISTAKLMENLDSNLAYGGARKISEDEAELLDQLDEIYDDQIKMKRELDETKRRLKKEQENLKKTDEAINECCSNMTRLKILVARGWQLSSADGVDRETVLNSLSDKQLVGELMEQDKKEITMQALVKNAMKSEASRIGVIDKVNTQELAVKNSEKGVSLDE